MATMDGRAAAHADPHAALVRLGRRVHDVRAERGFSLQEFATLAGVSAPQLSALERGEAQAAVGVLVAAAEALELTLAELVTEPERRAPQPAAPVATVAPVGHGGAPPPGYVPLAMPDVWEPPTPAPAAGQDPAPVPTPVYAAAVTPVVAAPAPALVGAPAPRTFADLRRGALADRTFETLAHFAVAAVSEAGHPTAVVAKIFRIPTWRLEGWLRDGLPPTPRAAVRRR
jgi:transcriptional regulator with XRE-family HTH domain